MSIERSTRRAEINRELDRETWSDLDKIVYEFIVKGSGEAVAGPFWFGRAFDAPPYFSFSAVAQASSMASHITIGVAEWLQDEQDMYVGAMLWVAFNACHEPYPTGTVLNEGFETLIHRQGGGPEGNELIVHGLFPGTANLSRRGWGWWSTNLEIHLDAGPDANQGAVGFVPIELTRVWLKTDDPNQEEMKQLKFGDSSPYRVFNFEMPSQASFEGYRKPTGVGDEEKDFFQRTNWHVVTDNPSTGTHHLRSVQPSVNLADDDTFVSGRPLLAWGDTFPCFQPHLVYDWFEGVRVEGDHNASVDRPAWRVEQGMEVRLTLDAYISKYDIVDGAYFDNIRYFFSLYDQYGNGLSSAFKDPQGNILDSVSNAFDLITAEGQYDRFSSFLYEVIHPDAAYMLTNFSWQADLRVSHGLYEEKYLDIDNLKMEIIGPQQPNQAARFDVRLNFEGRILKNYHNIHPIESFSHPKEVVLS